MVGDRGTLRVDGATTNVLTAIALVLATPGFVFFGWLSDKIGRKPIILAGCLLAMLTYFPAIRSADSLCQSGAVCSAIFGAGHGDCGSAPMLVPVRSHR
jgi:MFS family permease